MWIGRNTIPRKDTLGKRYSFKILGFCKPTNWPCIFGVIHALRVKSPTIKIHVWVYVSLSLHYTQTGRAVLSRCEIHGSALAAIMAQR